MHLALTPEGALVLFIALLASGLVMGFLAGFFGIGGGAILVPVLYEAFRAIGIDQSILMQLCLGTSLAVMVPTSITSFRQHRAKGTTDLDLLRRIGPWVVMGVILGAVIARYAPGRALMGIWAFIGYLIAAKMALGRDDWRLGERLPGRPVVEIYGFVTGLLSSLMSVGGSVFLITLMTLYGRTLLQSVSTGSGLGPLISIPGTLGFIWAGWGMSDLPPFSLGFVSPIGAAIVIPMSVYAAPFGVRAAHGVEKRWLEIAFALFLATMSTRFLIGLVG